MRSSHRIALFAASLCFAALPVSAADFTVMGSYWDTDVAGDAAGGGLVLGMPFNDSLAFELRASYFEELTDDPLENAFDSDDPVFQERGIQVLPLEAGLRFTFGPGEHFRPHVAGGASYFILDSDFGEIDDELGYFAALGGTVGDGDGPQFYFEGLWRKATAQVRLDPEDLEDVDDVDVEDQAEFDIDGFGANVGIRWAF
jgi:hypothetical protein